MICLISQYLLCKHAVSILLTLSIWSPLSRLWSLCSWVPRCLCGSLGDYTVLVPVILLLVWEFGGLHSPGSCYLVACLGDYTVLVPVILLLVWGITQSWFLLSCCLCRSLGDYTVLVPVILLLVWEFGGLHSPGSCYLVACVGVWGITQSWFLLSCCLCGSLGDYTVLVPVILLLLVWEFGRLHSPGSCYLVACVGVWEITQSWFLLSCCCLCGSLGDYTVLVPIILLLVWEFGGLHSPGSCYLVVACVGVWEITQSWFLLSCCLCGSLGDYTVLVPVILLLLVWEFGRLHSPGSCYLVACVGVWEITQSWFLLSCCCLCGSLGDYTVLVPVILLLVWEFGRLHSPGSCYLVVACVGVWGITQSWFLLSCWNRWWCLLPQKSHPGIASW